jgi:hypothetical protein
MRPGTFVWLPLDTAAIAAVQTLAAPGALLLNGNLSKPNISNGIFVNNVSMIIPENTRTITLTSVNNLAAVNFTISGISGGVPVSEVLAGPNNNTVTSVNFYSRINSIVTSAAAAAVSAGIGSTGFTNLFTHNHNASVSNVGLSVVVINGNGAITYTYYSSLFAISEIAASAWVTNSFAPIAGMTGANTNQFAQLTMPVEYSFINVTASSGTAQLLEAVLQQGIRG